jgi:hypothetical protein
MVRRKVRDDDEIVSILDINNEQESDISSSDSNCKINDADTIESESCTSNSDRITGAAEVSNWLQVTDSDPRLSTTIPVQNNESKEVVPSSFDWTNEPVEYLDLFSHLDLLDLILHETTLNENKKIMQNMLPAKRARITDWLP